MGSAGCASVERQVYVVLSRRLDDKKQSLCIYSSMI